MEKVRITKLSPTVRSFLSHVKRGKGLLVEDTEGRTRYGVIRYEEAPAKEQAAALKRLVRLQKKVGNMMARTGKTEKELDRLLQDNDDA